MARTETDANGVKHSITWYVWAGGQKMRHTAGMRGQWGWDAECSCGQGSHTGGAVKSSVQQWVFSHKWDFRNVAETDAYVAEVMAMSPEDRMREMARMNAENEKMLAGLREQGLLR